VSGTATAASTSSASPAGRSWSVVPSTPVDGEKPYCTCGGGKGYALDDEQSEVKQLWVCVGCGKPSKMYLEGWLAELGFYE
jgi:hypothetical protein